MAEDLNRQFAKNDMWKATNTWKSAQHIISHQESAN